MHKYFLCRNRIYACINSVILQVNVFLKGLWFGNSETMGVLKLDKQVNILKIIRMGFSLPGKEFKNKERVKTKAGVPSHFGISERFSGRQFFHEQVG